MRIILYTGKGGVGKTTAAAATAVQIAAEGKRILVMSTDQAHSLSDSFGIKLEKEPVQITDCLWAMEIDVVYESEKSWGNLKDYIRQMLTIRGNGGIEVEELLVFPGMEELFSMFKILEMHESNNYDVLIVDCAPTGETLSLLKYPEMMSEFMHKVLPIKRKGVKFAGPAVEKIMKIPMPKDMVFDDIELLMDKMERLYQLMMDKEVFSLRIVTTPEKIVIAEAKRNFTYLCLYDYNVDAVIVNKVYPKEAMEGYFSKWQVLQKEALQEIRESFSEVPQFHLELQKQEICGFASLKQAGKQLFPKGKAEGMFFSRKAWMTKKQGETMELKVLLPFVEKEELELKQTETEIIIEVKNQQRRIPVSMDMKKKELIGAKREGEYLTITFQ